MKKVFLLLIVAVLGCVFIAYRNNDPKVVISDIIARKGDIKKGELKYKIYLLGVLPIGEAIFGLDKVEEYMGRRVYHLSAAAQSSKLLSGLFSGSAALDSYVDIEDFNPILFKQKIIISGKKDSDKEIIYDQENRVMSMGGTRRQILVNTQDPLSAIFNLRRIDLNKVKEFTMNINTNQKNYVLKGKAVPGVISAVKRTHKIILVKAEISRSDKNLYHKSRITMVLLQGEGNIPILIKVFAGGILMNARLIEIK